MKKLFEFCLFALFALNMNSFTIAAVINWDDGQSHAITDATYQNDDIYLDQNVMNVPGTYVNLESEGTVNTISAYHYAGIALAGNAMRIYGYDNAAITMADGDIGGLDLYNNAALTVSDGYVYALTAHDNTRITVGGTGTVGMFTCHSFDDSNITVDHVNIFDLSVYNNGHITMAGGVVSFLSSCHNGVIDILGGQFDNRWAMLVYDSSIIYLHGSNFEVNGQPLAYGDKFSNYAELVGTGDDAYYSGIITGTLCDGSDLNNEFSVYNIGQHAGTADIIIIPEPASLFLFALGGLALRLKRPGVVSDARY